MKVVVAVDSLKGSLTSLQAGAAVRRGILSVDESAQVVVCPVADGGEGTADALTEGMGGERRYVRVTGPLGDPVEAMYGIVPGDLAVIEMSQAAGLPLVPADRRNPLYTTTRGVGEMIADAVRRGCRRFIIGIGGSATNDGGVGMLQALGYHFYDRNGQEVQAGAIGLRDLERIDGSGAMPELAQCSFRVACDVNNPLCGPNGCSQVFGPQKGATPEMIRDMDGWMSDWAQKVREMFTGGNAAGETAEAGGYADGCMRGTDADPNVPGSGAAGGLGYALRVFLGAGLEPGVRIVIEETHLEEQVKRADLVLTGEGRLDGQTAMGKAPAGVAALARNYGVPVIALGGSVADDAGNLSACGIDACFSILRRPCSLEEAMEPATAAANMEATGREVYRLAARLL